MKDAAILLTIIAIITAVAYFLGKRRASVRDANTEAQKQKIAEQEKRTQDAKVNFDQASENFLNSYDDRIRRARERRDALRPKS